MEKHTSEAEKHHIKVHKDIIKEFRLLQIKKFKKEGSLKIASNVVVGEFMYSPTNGFSKFGKGTYNVYKIDDNLVLSKKPLNKTSASKIIWKDTGAGVGVDGGTFGFWDHKYLETLARFLIKQSKKKMGKKRIGYLKHKIPDFFNIWSRTNLNDTIFIKIKNLNESDDFIDYGFDENLTVGVISPTGTGDGYFGCYSDNGNALLLMGGFTGMNLYDMVDEHMPPHLEVVKKYVKRKSRKGSKKRKGSRKRSKKRKGSRKRSR